MVSGFCVLGFKGLGCKGFRVEGQSFQSKA